MKTGFDHAVDHLAMWPNIVPNIGLTSFSSTCHILFLHSDTQMSSPDNQGGSDLNSHARLVTTPTQYAY